MRRVVLAALVVVCAVFVVAPAGLGAKGGNSANAKLCQKGGWQDWVRADQTLFASEEQCVSYGASGGVLTAPVQAVVSAFPFAINGAGHFVNVQGSGFLPNTEITFTVGTAAFFDNELDTWPVVTDAGGSFVTTGNSVGDLQPLTYFQVACPSTTHVTATDGTRTASTDYVC